MSAAALEAYVKHAVELVEKYRRPGQSVQLGCRAAHARGRERRRYPLTRGWSVLSKQVSRRAESAGRYSCVSGDINACQVDGLPAGRCYWVPRMITAGRADEADWLWYLPDWEK